MMISHQHCICYQHTADTGSRTNCVYTRVGHGSL